MYGVWRKETIKLGSFTTQQTVGDYWYDHFHDYSIRADGNTLVKAVRTRQWVLSIMPQGLRRR